MSFSASRHSSWKVQTQKNICIFQNLLTTKMYNFILYLTFHTIVTLMLMEGSSIINSSPEELLIEQTLDNATCKANISTISYSWRE